MITRTSLIATGAVLVALGVAACGSDEADDTAAATTSATTTSAAAGAGTAAPAAEELQVTLTKFFDPAVPATDKVTLIEDGGTQAAVLEQFNGVLQGYPLTAEVINVVPVDDDTVTATATITGPHGGAPTDVTFDSVNGTWVISDDAACAIFGMGHLTCAQ